MSSVIDVPVIENSNLTMQMVVPDSLRVVEDSLPPPKHGMFRIINHKDGDKRVVWNSESLAEIQAAKEMFDDLKKKMTPYKVGKGGAKTEIMKEFDPMVEQILFAPTQLAMGG